MAKESTISGTQEPTNKRGKTAAVSGGKTVTKKTATDATVTKNTSTKKTASDATVTKKTSTKKTATDATVTKKTAPDADVTSHPIPDADVTRHPIPDAASVSGRVESVSPFPNAVEPPEITADMALITDVRDSDFLDQVNGQHNSAPPETQEGRLADKEYLTRELSRRELARRSYRRYLYYVHKPTWKRTRMSDFLADEIQRFVETDTGNSYDILIIETPPQSGKSITITESFPSWYLGRYPKNRIIEASYNDDTAKRFGRKNLEKVEQFGGSLFGLKPGSIWTKTEFELANGWGRMISRGIMSGITGNPANLLIIDDPIKNREEADSSVYREKLWGEWQNTLKTRLAAGAKIILIMTPWHEDDLAARILQRENNVRLIRLPVEAEEHDLLGRKVGDSLVPEIGKDNEWLRQFKQGYLNDPKQGGLRAWQALFQCSPRVEGGNLVRREWWRYYDPEEVKTFGATVISVDAAFKAGENNDFVAIQVWGKRGIDYYLRYSVNKHLDFPGTVEAIRTIRRLFPDTTYILIEDKANGSAIIQTLRKEFIGVIGLTPKGGKVSRVNAISPAIESGHVYLPKDCLWTEEFVDQFTAFPAGAHDDMVDACSQCIGFLLFSGGSGYLPESKADREERELEEASTELLADGGYDVYGQDAGY